MSSSDSQINWTEKIFSVEELFRRILVHIDLNAFLRILWRVCKIFEKYSSIFFVPNFHLINNEPSVISTPLRFLMDSRKCLEQPPIPASSNKAPSNVLNRCFLSVTDVAAGRMLEVSQRSSPDNTGSLPILEFSRIDLRKPVGQTDVNENVSAKETKMENEPKKDSMISPTFHLNPEPRSTLFFRRQVSQWPDKTHIPSQFSISLLITNDSSSTLEPAHIFSMVVQPSASVFEKKTDFVSGFKSFSPDHFKSLKTLLLCRVVINESLISFINSTPLEVLYLNDCYIGLGNGKLLGTIKNLKRLYFTPCLKFPRVSRIQVPEKLEELVIYCPKSENGAETLGGPEFDLLNCLSLKYL